MAQSHDTIKKKSSITIPLRIHRNKIQKLDLLVRKLHARSRNEIIRDAIDQYISQMMETKIIEVRDVSVDEAARLIDDYISKNSGKHYVSELSEELGIELGTAFKAAQKLIDAGEVKKRRTSE